jgi:general secretion pathway protein G
MGGFTLLELMAVILVIALLGALLLPVLGRGQRAVRSVYCLGQMRQWGLAIWLYAEDQDDFFPYEGHFLTPLHRGLNREAWYNVLAPYIGQAPLMILYGQGQVPLPGERSLYTCPGVSRKPSYQPDMSRPYFMYGFNSRLDPNGPARFRRHQVRYPARTVTFTENSEGRHPATAGRFTRARHDGCANLAFADGHAANVRSNEFFRTLAADRHSELEWALDRTVYWYPFKGAPQ